MLADDIGNRRFVGYFYYGGLYVNLQSRKFGFTYHDSYEITPGDDYYCNMLPLPKYFPNSDIKEDDYEITIPGQFVK